MSHNQKTDNQLMVSDHKVPFKFSSLFKYALFFLINLGSVFFIGYMLKDYYLRQVEIKVSDIVSKNLDKSSELDSLKYQLNEMKNAVSALKSKVDIIDKTQNIPAVKQSLENVEKSIDDKNLQIDSKYTQDKKNWCHNLIIFIKTGKPLDDFLKNTDIPREIQNEIKQVGVVPTYKDIIGRWNNLKDKIRFKSDIDETNVAESPDWLNNIKSLLKEIFHVRYINKDYLTPEENFLRTVDNLLLKEDIKNVYEFIASHESKFETLIQDDMMVLMNDIERFRKGQKILEMVQKYSND